MKYRELTKEVARRIAGAIDASVGSASDAACHAAALAALSTIIKPVSMAPRDVVVAWVDEQTDLPRWDRIMRPAAEDGIRWWADLPDMGGRE